MVKWSLHAINTRLVEVAITCLQQLLSFFWAVFCDKTFTKIYLSVLSVIQYQFAYNNKLQANDK